MQTTELITATAIETTPEELVLVLGARRVRSAWDKCSATLASATEAERFNAELSPGGYGIHWPLFDEDLSANGLLRAIGARTKMNAGIKLLEVVALTEDLPERNLRRGQVGTVVELLGPGSFEVEFTDNDGRAFACLALHATQLMILHYEPVEVA